MLLVVFLMHSLSRRIKRPPARPRVSHLAWNFACELSNKRALLFIIHLSAFMKTDARAAHTWIEEEASSAWCIIFLVAFYSARCSPHVLLISSASRFYISRCLQSKQGVPHLCHLLFNRRINHTFHMALAGQGIQLDFTGSTFFIVGTKIIVMFWSSSFSL